MKVGLILTLTAFRHCMHNLFGLFCNLSISIHVLGNGKSAFKVFKKDFKHLQKINNESQRRKQVFVKSANT